MSAAIGTTRAPWAGRCSAISADVATSAIVHRHQPLVGRDDGHFLPRQVGLGELGENRPRGRAAGQSDQRTAARVDRAFDDEADVARRRAAAISSALVIDPSIRLQSCSSASSVRRRSVSAVGGGGAPAARAVSLGRRLGLGPGVRGSIDPLPLRLDLVAAHEQGRVALDQVEQQPLIGDPAARVGESIGQARYRAALRAGACRRGRAPASWPSPAAGYSPRAGVG